MAPVSKDIPSQLKTEDAIRESDTKFRIMAEFTVSAIFVYQGMRFTYVNPATEHLTGYSRKELLKMKFNDLFPEYEMKKVRNLGLRAQRGDTISSHSEFRIITKNGEERWIDLTTSKIMHNKKKAVLGTAFDITEHKRAELLQDTVFRIAQAADRSKGLDELFPAIHAIIAEVMNAENFYIALYDSKRDVLSFPYFVDEVNIQPQPSKPGKGLTEYVFHSGKSLLVDLALHNELCNQGEIELEGVPSAIWLGVPLLVNNEALGAMVVQHYSDPKVYSDWEKRILEFVSSQVAMVIDRKRSEDAIRESEERYHRRATELELLYQVSLAAAQIHSLPNVAQRIVDAIEKLLKWNGSIWLVEDDKPVLLAHCTMGLTGESLINELRRIDELIPSLDDGIIGWVCKSGKTVCTGNVKNTSPYIVANNTINSELCVPLNGGGKTIGCINVESEITNAFSEHDERLLTTLANQAAVAIENARLFEETRRRAIRQSALNAIITVSARALEPIPLKF